MNSYQKYLITALGTLLLTGCATTNQSQTYPSTPGVVIAEKPVTISGGGKIGTVMGALAGGYGGSTLTKNAKPRAEDTAGGAALGAAIGDLVEHEITDEAGTEYTVKTVNGSVMTIDQPTDPNIQINSHVLIITQDGKMKLIADTSAPAREGYEHRRHHHRDRDYDEDYNN